MLERYSFCVRRAACDGSWRLTLVLCITDSWTMGWIWNSRSEDIVANGGESLREREEGCRGFREELRLRELRDIQSLGKSSMLAAGHLEVAGDAGAIALDGRRQRVGPTVSGQGTG